MREDPLPLQVISQIFAQKLEKILSGEINAINVMHMEGYNH